MCSSNETRISMRPADKIQDQCVSYPVLFVSCSSQAVTLHHPLLASVSQTWWFPSVSLVTQLALFLRELPQSPSHCSQTTVTSGILTPSPVDWAASPHPHTATPTGPQHQNHRASSPQVGLTDEKLEPQIIKCFFIFATLTSFNGGKVLKLP